MVARLEGGGDEEGEDEEVVVKKTKAVKKGGKKGGKRAKEEEEDEGKEKEEEKGVVDVKAELSKKAKASANVSVGQRKKDPGCSLGGEVCVCLEGFVRGRDS